MFERRQTFDYSQQSSGGGGGAQKAPEEDDSFKAKVVDYGHGGTSSDATANIVDPEPHSSRYGTSYDRDAKLFDSREELDRDKGDLSYHPYLKDKHMEDSDDLRRK